MVTVWRNSIPQYSLDLTEEDKSSFQLQLQINNPQHRVIQEEKATWPLDFPSTTEAKQLEAFFSW